MSPIGGGTGTVTYATKDPALLFDYVRRGQLGTETRGADRFRELAYAAQTEREERAKTSTQLESEVAQILERDR